jgi:predicted N-acetyltransferase YhbS
MTTVKIRRAKPLDASNLARLLFAAHDEASAYPEVDQVYGLNWITQTLSNGFVIVADASGRVVGTLALTRFNFPWSPQVYLYLEWLFVQRKFRKGGAFEALIQAAHAFADEHKLPILAGVTSADAKVFLKDKLFKQHGYTYMGGDFVRSAHGRQQEEEDHSDIQASGLR